MFKLSDRQYLLTEQYQSASNLNARIQLHTRFSTNPSRSRAARPRPAHDTAQSPYAL